MSYWSWDQSLSVGVDVIDGQHQRIVDYINDLHLAKQEQNRDKVSTILTALVDYTRTHFVFEEDIMKQSRYPLAESHKKVHDAFILHINEYIRQHESGKDVTPKLLSELQIWLTNHIKKDDRDYALCVNKMTKKGWIQKTLSRFFG
ncbi:bacteriohemerythrin [Thiobaca trueperi]|uniref:Hemerythrin n=1 Tax=Thiobaca trueperi TaxID=127458 RepID=A0A4R3MWL5_9GAMM|nr:bacteriohemerythrin [Thiobaca trueperi]TCT20655.1 hemerythrin [Thiobaca trueperi]